MKKVLLIALLLQAVLNITAQKKVDTTQQDKRVIIFPPADSIPPRDKASAILAQLKGDGVVIVRLKTNQKSVDAYRKAGREDIASKIEEDRRNQNLKMFNAFKDNFTFCKVYFIYASDTKKMLDGENVFLKLGPSGLAIDHTITLPGDNYVFCEYGSAVPFSDFKETRYVGVHSSGGTPVPSVPDQRKFNDSIPPKTTTSPASTNAIVFYDKDLEQLKRPFPYLEPVHTNWKFEDDYDGTVRVINSDLVRAYYRLVTKPAVKEKVKASKQKAKPANGKGH